MKRQIKYEYILLPVIHLAITVPLAWYMNIWSDEASTLFTTRNGLTEALQNTIRYEKQAPLYFILMSVWREIDSSIFFARIFSIVCSSFSIVIFIDLVKRLWNRNTAILAGFFFAVHPFLVWVSTEIRVYALIVLITLILLSLFERGYLRDQDNQSNARYGFLAVAVFGLYTNFYIGFTLAAFFAGLLVIRRFRSAKTYFVHMTIVGVLFLPLVWITATHFETGFDGFAFEKSAAEGLRAVWNHILSFSLPTERFPPETQTSVSAIRLWLARVLAVVAVGMLVLKRKLPDWRFLFFAAVSAVIAGFLLATYFALNLLYVELRHAAVLFPSMLLLLVGLLHELAPARKGRFVFFAAAAVLFAFFYSYGLTAVQPGGLTKRGDWERVARYVENNERPGQPVVVFRNYEALAFLQNYNGPNKVLPDDKYFHWNYEGEFGTAEMWPKQIEYTISMIPKDAKEVWLLTEELCQTGPACVALEKFVKENYTVVETKDFYRERVRLLRKK